MAADDLPVGFTVDPGGLPDGFKLDPAAKPTVLQAAMKQAVPFVSALARGGPTGLIVEGGKQALSGIDKASKAVGGFATDKAAEMGVRPEVAGAIGTAAEILPQTALGAGAGAAVKAPFEWLGKRLMQSSLKPTSENIANGNAAKAIQTMLDEGINATAGGAAKLLTEIDKLKDHVGSLIAQSPAVVDKAFAASELFKTLDKLRKNLKDADESAVLKTWQEFTSKVGAKIPVAEAQAIKEAKQTRLRDSYGKTTVNPAEEAADKAITRGMRLGIEDVVPGVGEANARNSSLINVLRQLEPRLGQAANRDMGGLAPVAPNGPQAALMLADRNPWLKSMLAQILYGNRERLPAAVGGAAANVQSQ